MRTALALARRGLGNVWPNPAVGCVIVDDGLVAGRGWTQPGGRPHAETEALRRAGARARGATAYVSLEPCSHRGATAPCVEALLEAGIGRCVVTVEDPDPRVAGRGIERLRAAGLEVITGVCAATARELNAGFFMRVERTRPLITLKLATTLDGCIATAGGESRWITGPLARQRAHLMRAAHDAVMVGVGTAITDRPQLTCRLPGLEDRSPVRVVVDSGLRLPLTSPLVAGAGERATWIVTRASSDRSRRAAFTDCGVEVIEVGADGDGRAALDEAMAALAERGITRLLVEGGHGLAASLLRARLVDRLAWFHAPTILGGDGLAATAPLGLERLADAPGFERLSVTTVGEDILETYAILA